MDSPKASIRSVGIWWDRRRRDGPSTKRTKSCIHEVLTQPLSAPPSSQPLFQATEACSATWSCSMPLSLCRCCPPTDINTLGPDLPVCLLFIFMIQWRLQFCGVILDFPGKNSPFLSSTAFWLCVLLGSLKLYGICGLLLRALHPWYPLPGSLFCLITAGLTLSPLWAFSQMPHSHCLPWSPWFFTTFPTGTLPISCSALFFAMIVI